MVVTDSPRNGPSALLRLNQDVLQRKGLRHVIVLEGINDIRGGANAADIIAAYQQIIDRVHAKGAKIYGGTILAFKGTSGYTAAKEDARAAVNNWIRTSGKFDGLVEFDIATRDPADPLRLNPSYERPDHLHPNDADYAAMGNASTSPCSASVRRNTPWHSAFGCHQRKRDSSRLTTSASKLVVSKSPATSSPSHSSTTWCSGWSGSDRTSTRSA